MDVPVDTWFWVWLREHKALLPHRGWDDYPEGDHWGECFFRGWIEDFRAAGFTLADARAASVKLQKDHPGFPEHHLAPVLAMAGEIRRRREADEAARRRAEERAREAEEAAWIKKARLAWEDMEPEDRRRRVEDEVREIPALEFTPKFAEVMALKKVAIVLKRRAGVHVEA